MKEPEPRHTVTRSLETGEKRKTLKSANANRHSTCRETKTDSFTFLGLGVC